MDDGGEQREDDRQGERDDMLASQSRTLRNSIISLAVFFGIVVLLLLAVPGLRTAAEKITDAEPGWVLGGIGFEVLSCVGYMVLFDLVFGRIGRSLVTRLSLSELAVNSVVSVSGLAGLALGAWVLRERGLSVERIAKRTVLIFVLTSAVSRRSRRGDRDPDVARPAPGLDQSPADAPARLHRGGGDRRHDRRGALGGAPRGGPGGERQPHRDRADRRQRRGRRRAAARSAATTGGCSAPSATGCSTC